MPAAIRLNEITLLEPLTIEFGFSGLSQRHATSILRDLVREKWDPRARRHGQCVYVVRLAGEVAASYAGGFSPVVYVGEGGAYSRLHTHTANWLAPLVLNVPRLGIEIRIAEIARRNHTTLYQYVEADLLGWFVADYQALPWFNRQREPSKEGRYPYEPEAEKELRRLIGVGSGNKFLWAIHPTPNNPLHEPYAKGVVPDE